MTQGRLGELVRRLRRESPASARRFGFGSRVLLALAFAAVPLFLAQSLAFNLMMAGFPDGAVTDYDRARAAPGDVLVDASLLVGCGLAVMGFLARRRRDIARMSAVLLTHAALFEAANYALDYVLKFVLKLDYGLGG